ncbi:TPA: hypothetical protein DEW05_05845 [Candidatus Saccharibacteria bacterium]|nr:hypothetical protein [Candidatus Saccharibacteria bacterium]
MASYYFTDRPEAEAYAAVHLESLPMLHAVGNSALIGANVAPSNTSAEYKAFCHGFTTIDYLATLLDARPFVQLQNGVDMKHFYLDSGEMADFELWQRRQAWMQSHQNTLDVLRTVSDARAESPKQFAARAIGAQVASELLFVK